MQSEKTNKISENKHDLRNIEQWGKNATSGLWCNQVEPTEAERCVLDAISVGYRMIDTAQIYHNMDIFNFSFEEEDMAMIRRLDTKQSFLFSHDSPQVVEFITSLGR